MYYQSELTVPANTLITSPAETDMILIDGIINQVELVFPPGSAGLLKIAIFYHEFRLWPSTPEAWFYHDDYTYRWAENFRVDESPFQLRLVGYNEDEVYQHTAILYIGMTVEALTTQAYLANLLAPQQRVQG